MSIIKHYNKVIDAINEQYANCIGLANQISDLKTITVPDSHRDLYNQMIGGMGMLCVQMEDQCKKIKKDFISFSEKI